MAFQRVPENTIQLPDILLIPGNLFAKMNLTSVVRHKNRKKLCFRPCPFQTGNVHHCLVKPKNICFFFYKSLH